VALLALSTIASQAHALLYLLVFGLGTVLGMALITLAIAWGFRFTSSVLWARRALMMTAGAVSCVVGLMMFGELLWA
jgi:high-affinity nickel-transport protein